MAHLGKSILGGITGSIGDVTIRQRNGKSVISAKPKSFMPGYDQGSIERRARFAVSAKLATSIYSIPELKSIWRDNTPAGKSAYNFIVTSNLKLVGPNSLTELATITPKNGFPVEALGIKFGFDVISAVINPIGTDAGIDPLKQLFVKLVAVTGVFIAESTASAPPEFVALVSEEQKLVLDGALSFTLPLHDIDMKVLESPGERQVMMAVILLEEDRRPSKFSSTIHIK